MILTRFLRFCGFVLLCSTPVALAQGSFPSRTVRLVVGFPPGGATDISARAIGQKLNEIWQQPVVIENRPGASGAIAAEAVKKAPPDGYVVLFGSSNEMTVMPNLIAKLSFDPIAILFRFLSPSRHLPCCLRIHHCPSSPCAT